MRKILPLILIILLACNSEQKKPEETEKDSPSNIKEFDSLLDRLTLYGDSMEIYIDSFRSVPRHDSLSVYYHNKLIHLNAHINTTSAAIQQMLDDNRVSTRTFEDAYLGIEMQELQLKLEELKKSGIDLNPPAQ